VEYTIKFIALKITKGVRYMHNNYSEERQRQIQHILITW